MSLFLRFASAKCPVRTISCLKRFYRTSHSFTFVEGLGIRYFLPRTADTVTDIQTKQMKDQHSLPEEFNVIYNFPYEKMLGGIFYSAVGFACLFIWIIYDPTFWTESDERKKEEENEPFQSKELVFEDNNNPSGVVEEMKTPSYSLFGNQQFFSGDPRAKALAGLAMLIYFFYIRSRCVLKIYRHNNDYITVLYQALSLRKRLIKHKASDCFYFPKRKFFRHNVMGKNVITFNESFVNYQERQFYSERKMSK